MLKPKSPAARPQNRLKAWALCSAVGATVVACTMAASITQAAAPGGGRGRGGAAAGAPQPTLEIDTSKLDSSKTKDLPAVFAEENSGAKIARPKLPTMEEATPIAPFPDPFAYVSDPLGKTRSTKFEDWQTHRQEIMAMIEKYEIGTKPVVDIATQVTATYNAPAPAGAPAVGAWVDGPATDVMGFGGAGGGLGGGRRGAGGAGGGGPSLAITVKNKDKSLTLNCPISIPANAKPPYKVLIAAGGSSLPGNFFAERGIVTVSYNNNYLTQDGQPNANQPYFQLYPEQKFSSRTVKGDTGQYSAWAWGASRIIDGFTLVKDKFPVDMNHIAITGCSRNGKLALFAGAFDERIALTIAQESGGGGATNWRFSATEPLAPTAQEPNKTSVEGITSTDHQWFASQMFTYGGENLPKLPVDHHMLTALCAPRALYVTGNTDFVWLSNKSLYANSKATHRVYSELGVADRFGYVVNGGHQHCAFPASQNPELAYFLDRFMMDDKTQSKYITTAPAAFASVDADRWTQWWGTGKADLPPAKQ